MSCLWNKVLSFYSHPNNLLVEHLNSVGKLAESFVKNIDLKYSWLSDIARIIGLCHDFGKYTSFFQKYLKNKEFTLNARHSLISSLLSFHETKKYVNKNSNIEKTYLKEFLPLISYIAVHRHHTDLRSPEEIIPRKREINNFPEIEYINAQLEDMKKNFSIINKEMNRIGITDLENFLKIETIIEIFENLDRLRYELIEKDVLNEQEKLEIYFLTILLFSTLIDADKKTAGISSIVKISRKEILDDLVDIFIREKFKHLNLTEMNKIRNEIYKKVRERITNISINEKLFTLTSPTGSGKTLASLSFALKLREKIRKEKGFTPRIIYSLPFISIIEQNYKVFEEVLSLLPDFEMNISSYLIKHHHLSTLEYKEGNEFKPIDEALLLIESWESEIVVTTFVQFLQSIIGFKNNFLKKIHNIAGSIIILDEVQSIPIEYWDLVDKILKGLSDILNCRIILMTATKPLILTESSKELLEENKKYFTLLNRVRIKPYLDKKITLDEFIEWFPLMDGKSYIIVLNTIRKSIEIYNNIKKRYNIKKGFTEFEFKNSKFKKIEKKELISKLMNEKFPIFYLSTNITPLQRLERIQILKELINLGGKPIVVSTQAIEAGVDLDFDIAVRDIGPIDSIIQVAGRCNRNNDKQIGEVYVINLEDGCAETVYGKIHPLITTKLLQREVSEAEFYELSNEFYKKVKESTKNESQEIYKAILNLCFHHDYIPSISKFELIKEKGEFFDVFIELDEESIQIRKCFEEEVLNEKDLIKRKFNFLNIKNGFNKYLLSVRKEIIQTNYPPYRFEDTDIFCVPHNQLSSFYDLETGYRLEQTFEII